MQKKIIFISLIFIDWFISSCEYDRAVEPSYSGWKIYNSSNSNLDSNLIGQVVTNNTGVVWIVVGIGKVMKFNGVDWEYITVPNSDPIGFITTDQNGRFWLLSSTKVYVFDGINWMSYSLPFHVGGAGLRSIKVDQNNNFWVPTSGGLWKFDGVSWNTYNIFNSGITANELLSLNVDIDNSIWLSAMGNPFTIGGQSGLSHFVGDSVWTNYNMSNSGLLSNGITDIGIESSGIKWFCTGRGLVSLNENSWKAYDSSTIAELSTFFPIFLYIDSDNNKWFYRDQHGLLKFNGNSWTLYNTGNSGIPDNTVTSVVMDNKKNLWIATYDKGIGVYTEN